MDWLSGILNTGVIGSLWQPKSGSVRVGRDVGALSATGFARAAPGNVVVGDGDDVALTSGVLFGKARDAARNGQTVKHFRSISDQDLLEGKIASQDAIYKNKDYLVAFADNTLTVLKKNAETGKFDTEALSTVVKEDTKVVWNTDGEPQILSGRAARTQGVLTAEGENEILFRMSGSDVEAGEGTVVYNLSEAQGTYSGGNNVTYLGAYQGGTFTDSKGKVTFGGYFSGASFSGLTGASEFSGVFEDVDVALENGSGAFSGYFSASQIRGSDRGNNTLSGMFLDACSVTCGDGDDTFSGRFIDSKLDGGEGENTFGGMGTHLARPPLAVPDFINAEVSSGSGKDRLRAVAWGSNFDLGDGDDTADGVFSRTDILGGSGNDSLKAVYANQSSFAAGEGDDAVDLATAVANTVTTGKGSNTVVLGRKDVSDRAMTWQTREEYDAGIRPAQTGEIARNTVHAAAGANAVTIHNGESAQKVLTSDAQRQSEQQNIAGSGEEGLAPDGASKRAASGGRHEEKIDRARAAAINRYRFMLGSEPQESDGPAATVVYADGSQDTFGAAARKEIKSQSSGGMIRMIRRYGEDGAVSWERWGRLAG